MTDPRLLNIQDYTYDLPDAQIAHYPLAHRDDSRLLIYENGRISDSTYAQIADFLPNDTQLVFNNTRVIRARLPFQKTTGGKIEIFCLEPDDQYASIATAMQQKGAVYWKCLVGGASKWKADMLLTLEVTKEKDLSSKILTPKGVPDTDDSSSGEEQQQPYTCTTKYLLTAARISKEADYFTIKFSWDNTLTFSEILALAGQLPLPPYMNRTAEAADEIRYQTIYAAPAGSVAAPTAGLHFTEKIFASLEAKRITSSFVTLHVGAGTFQPVKTATMEEHPMHAEFLEISAQMLKIFIAHKGLLVCVGTTSLRTMESLYWMGVKLILRPSITLQELEVKQWDAYDMKAHIKLPIDKTAALNALLQFVQRQPEERLIIKTAILIAPGYVLTMANGLITNFHQPQSTLLLLIAAIVGPDWRNMYQYALDKGFRFLSYGDGSLIWASQAPLISSGAAPK